MIDHRISEAPARLLKLSVLNLRSNLKIPEVPRFQCKGIKDSLRFSQGVKCLDNKKYHPIYPTRELKGMLTFGKKKLA